MSRVVVLGEEARVQGFALAGALAVPAETAGEVRRAWHDLPDDVALVLLTPAAAGALGGTDPGDRLTVVLPP